MENDNNQKSKKLTPENELDPNSYTSIKFSKIKIIIVLLVVIIIGFSFNFPYLEKIDTFVKTQLNSIPNCPIHYKELTSQLFAPKIIINEAMLPARCIGQRSGLITIDKIVISITGISYSPFGLSTRLTINLGESQVELQQAISWTEQKVKLSNVSLHLDSLMDALSTSFKLSGVVNANGILSLSDNKVDSGEILIQSKNFKIPPQGIMAFSISKKLHLNLLQIKGNFENKNKLLIDHIIIGDDRAPIRAKFSGIIYIIQKNISNSTLDLKGEISFSEEFLSMPGMSFLKTLLTAFEKVDGFYQIKVGGTLGQPAPKPR